MPIITTLHYDGHGIELPEGFDVERLASEIQSAGAPTWIPVSDSVHNQHRILIGNGAGVRITTTHQQAPATPRRASSPERSIQDMQF